MNFQMSYVELIAAALSLWCVWLAAINNIWNWPVAMLGSILYMIVFYQSALYSDAFLNLVFLFFQGFGWYQWVQRGTNTDTLKPIFAKNQQWFHVLFVGLLSYYPWVLFVEGGTVQRWISPETFVAPRYLYLDAALFIVSVSALFMQAKRWIQHWWLWIFVDVIYVPIYVSTNNLITAILYLIYIPLAWKGYKMWRINLQERTTID
jgi:nicotinamide mononucleotide transporter